MIFVSHAWINGKPDEKVLKLVAQLRESGFEAYCDVMFAGDRTSIHFKQMMVENMQKSEKIIVVLSEEYKRKADLFEGGVGVEYKYILEDIDIHKKKYILVSFKTDLSEVEIPDGLRGREIICLGKDFDKLFYKLEDIQEYQFPEVNQRKKTVTPKKVYSSQDYANISENSIQPVKSRTQEYADKWEANMFLNDFSEWDENAGVNVKLKDVYIDEHLPHFIWKKNRKPSKNLSDLMSKYIIIKKENEMLLILGQPGIGKSTLITWITIKYKKNIEDILVYQFASDLKDIDWYSEDISENILKKLNLSNNELSDKTLILDGFDEINIGYLDRKKILDNLYDKFIYKKYIRKFTLIITCRENYIYDYEMLRCKYLTLLSWDNNQILSFCSTYLQKTKKQISKNTFSKIIENKEILGIPLILYMVLALNINIDNNNSIVDIYDKIFSLEGGIYDRCIDNKNFADVHRISEIKNQIHQISREIGMWMFENNSSEAYIPQPEYQKICIDVMSKSENKTEILQQDFKIGNYFKLIKHCEGLATEDLYFIHRSIYEYFVAEYIYNSISDMAEISKKELAKILGKLLKGNLLENEILRDLKHKIKLCKIKKLGIIINDTFHMMLNNGMIYYTNHCYKNIFKYEMNVFANMLEIIHMFQEINFKYNENMHIYLKINNGIPLNLRGFDFSKMNVEKSNLVQANLSGTNFSNSNLKQADLNNALMRFSNFHFCNLKNADLTGADLTGADLRDAFLENAIFNKANLRGVKLRRSNLTGAVLRDAKLEGADLSDTNLKNADLSNAELMKTKFINANLIASNMENADLRFAIFKDAKIEAIRLQGANIKGAIFSEKQIEYLEKYYNMKEDKNIKMINEIELKVSFNKKVLSQHEIDELLIELSKMS